MAIVLHQLTTALYLLAVIASGLAVGLRSRRASRTALGLLLAGFTCHTLAFVALHEVRPTPALTELPLAISMMGWLGTAAYLVLLLRVHGAALVIVVAPLAFASAFFASVALPGASPPEAGTSAFWSHLHVVLSSAGLALLGLAGASGLLYVIHHRSIKSKRPGALGVPLPSLEALDRVDRLGLWTGFLLLTLGLLAGVAWVQASEGHPWPGTLHSNASAAVWAVYALLLGARRVARLGARQTAIFSAAGFAVLALVVMGAGAIR